MENRILKNFTITPNKLINDETLDTRARFLFVYLCSKPSDWKWRAKHLEKSLSMSKNTRLKYTNELIDAGWISTLQKKAKAGEFGAMDIVLHSSPQVKNKATVQPQVKNSAAQNLRSAKTNLHSNTDLNTNTNIFSKTDEKVSLPEIALKYLNDKKPSKIAFKSSDDNLKELKALFKKKNEIEDVKAVIDFKIHEWKDNPKMKKYIRPSTLFGSKFDSYLVEAADFKETSVSLELEEFKYRPTKTVNLK